MDDGASEVFSRVDECDPEILLLRVSPTPVPSRRRWGGLVPRTESSKTVLYWVPSMDGLVVSAAILFAEIGLMVSRMGNLTCLLGPNRLGDNRSHQTVDADALGFGLFRQL